MRAPFAGEEMVCICCGRQQRAGESMPSGWRCLDFGSWRIYACPAEFPPDDATAAACWQAYRRVLEAALERGAKHVNN